MSIGHFQENKFKYNFQDTLDPFHNCCFDSETMAHFFLHCHNFMHQCQTLLECLSQTGHDISELNENLLTDILLFGNPKYGVSISCNILMTTISYI